jgi:hypothetical protein
MVSKIGACFSLRIARFARSISLRTFSGPTQAKRSSILVFSIATVSGISKK